MSGRNEPRPPPTTSSSVVSRPLRGGRVGRSGQPGRPYAPSRQRFEGETDALKGHVYDLIGSKSADLFITTTKHIAGYVGRTYTQGGDIRLAVENLTLPTLEGPTAPTTTDALTVAIFREEVKEFVKRTKKLEENVQLLWALVWGQASDAVCTKLEARRDHEDMRQRSAGVELLNAIKDLMYNVQELKYIPLAIHLARRHFYSSFQQRHVDAAHYLEQFNNRVDILERCGAALGEDPGTMRKVFEQEGIDPLTADEEQLQLVRAKAREWYLALAFLMGADHTRFGRNSWRHTKTTSHKGWIGTLAPGLMPSISWPITKKMSATTSEPPGPTMVWHSPQALKPTITPIHMGRMCHTLRTRQRHQTSPPPPTHNNNKGMPLSLQGVDVGATVMDVALPGEAQSPVSAVGTLDTMPLPVLIPSRRPNDALQQPNLPAQEMTVGQPSNSSCQAVGTKEWEILTLPTNSCRPPMAISKPATVLTSPRNGFYSIANLQSQFSATGDSSRTSVNPTGGCTSTATPALPEQISWGISVAMELSGTTRTASPTFSHWPKCASSST